MDARRLEDIETEREALRQRSEELEDFDGDRWMRAKNDIDQARQRLRDSLEGRDRR